MRRFAAMLLFTTAVAAAEPERGVVVENVASRADASQTYTLYLPRSYDSAAKHPLLFVFDPGARGTSAAAIFRDAAEEYGWIVISSNQTRSDASPEANERAVRALLPEARRYASDPQRLYAAGFSGMAILAWAVGIETGSFAGVIGVGGRLVETIPPAKFPFAHYGFAGDADFNNRDMRALDELLAREGKVHRFADFPGDHRWMPAALARDAVGWLEAIAMKEGLRERDQRRIAALFESDVAAAAALEPRSRLSALRRYRAIARTYDGLHPIDDVRAAVARLEGDAAVERERSAEARWDRFEAEFAADLDRRMPEIFTAMRQSDRPAEGELMRALRINELKRRAERRGFEGDAARRLLESVFTQMSALVPSRLFARDEYRLAAAALAVAASIHPDRWRVWYALGGAHARAGDRRRALDALRKAIDLGFDDAAQLARDASYASVGDAAAQLLRERVR